MVYIDISSFYELKNNTLEKYCLKNYTQYIYVDHM